MSSKVEEFVEEQWKMVELERDAQSTRSSERLTLGACSHRIRMGLALGELCITQCEVGLGALTMIRFGLVSGRIFPIHRITKGGQVLIYKKAVNLDKVGGGIVDQIDMFSITICVTKKHCPFEDDDIYFVASDFGEDSDRLFEALQCLRKAKRDNLVEECFGVKKPGTISSNDSQFKGSMAPTLNKPQKEAIQAGMNSLHLSLIHGPPGTGKTHCIAGIVDEALKSNLRVLVCAPSNAAVDNVGNILIRKGVIKSLLWSQGVVGLNTFFIRLGHPSRVATCMREFTLDSALEYLDYNKDCIRLRRKVKKMQERKSTRSIPTMTALIQDLRHSLIKKKKSLLSKCVSSARLILATCTGAAVLRQLNDTPFDIVIIDEATQSTEVVSWIPVFAARSSKLVLVGDDKQLEPTVISECARNMGFAISMFSRVHEQSSHPSIMLTVQYRMNEVIMNWSNQRFYENKLTAHETVKNIVLADLVKIPESSPFPGFDIDQIIDLLSIPILWIDTQGLSTEFKEEVGAYGARFNPGEVKVVDAYINFLIYDLKLPNDAVSVITPYALQRDKLKLALRDEINNVSEIVRVATVDSFQGAENEVIVLSLVRSNDNKDIGFLSDEKRLNVAITRGKRQVVIIGDAETLASDCGPLASLFEYCIDLGNVYQVSRFV